MIQFVLTISPLLLLASCCDNADFVKLPNKKCYKMFEKYVDNPTAIAACDKLNTQLVTIKSADDNKAIANYMIDQQQSSAWIGLTCTTIDNCKWVDGSDLSYKNFLNQDPDLSQGECYYISTGSNKIKRNLWLNANCDRMTNYFICEEKMKEPVCPNDYVEDPGSHNCFKVFHDLHSFPTAEAMCVAQGGHLASIHIYATNDFIYGLLQKNGISHAWIGLQTDAKSQASWTDGTTTEMVNANIATNPLEPNEAFYYSAQPDMFPKKWFGVNGTFDEPYLCQTGKELPTPTPMPTTITVIQTTAIPTGPNCGAVYFDGQSGKIVSPNYPYPFSMAQCNYLITGSNNVVNIQIPVITATRFWRIAVYDGDEPDPSKLIKSIYYGEENEVDVSSIGKTMFITFYSDPSNRGTAFSILYTSTTDPLYPTEVTISTTLPTMAPVTSCRANFHYDRNSGNCYLIGPPLSFAHSQSICMQQRGNLISIHSHLEEENLIEYLESIIGSKKERVWLGVTYNGNWQWTDGSPWDFQDWISDSPQLGHCAVAEFTDRTSEGWIPMDCFDAHWFICYSKPIN